MSSIIIQFILPERQGEKFHNLWSPFAKMFDPNDFLLLKCLAMTLFAEEAVAERLALAASTNKKVELNRQCFETFPYNMLVLSRMN